MGSICGSRKNVTENRLKQTQLMLIIEVWVIYDGFIAANHP